MRLSIVFLPSLLLFTAVQCSQTLERRQEFAGEATYFDVGLGACGEYSRPSDYMVALNQNQFDAGSTGYPGPQCFKWVTITHNGKTASARIMDRCPGCAFGDLDMSAGLFSYFEELGVGRFKMTWHWGGGGDPPPAPVSSSSSWSLSQTTSGATPTQASSTHTTLPLTSPLPSPTISNTSLETYLPGNLYNLNMMALMMGDMIPKGAEQH